MRILTLTLFMSTLFLFSGCYKIPSDDCVTTIPLTNNPLVIPQKGTAMPTPGVTY